MYLVTLGHVACHVACHYRNKRPVFLGPPTALNSLNRDLGFVGMLYKLVFLLNPKGIREGRH